MRHIGRCYHGDFHDAGNLAVLLPCRLVNHFVNALFLNGIGVAAAGGEQVADNLFRSLRVTLVEILSNQVAMFLYVSTALSFW